MELADQRFSKRLASTTVGLVETVQWPNSNSDCYPQQLVFVKGKAIVALGSQSFFGKRDAQVTLEKVKRMNNHQFTKGKLEKTLSQPNVSLVVKIYVFYYLGYKVSVRLARSIFRLKSQECPLSLQWLVEREEIQNED